MAGKWDKNNDRDDNGGNDEWQITDRMVLTFLKEWDELGSPDAVMEKYGAVRCANRNIPDDIMPEVALAGKTKNRVSKAKEIVFYYDDQDKYYEKYIRKSPYANDDKNIFRDWRIPIAFFKILEERAQRIKMRNEMIRKADNARLQRLVEQSNIKTI